MTLRKGCTPWNKGKKIAKSHPQMGFQKGNRLSDNPKSRSTQFQKGEHSSPETEFKKGYISPFGFKKGHATWNKGLKDFQVGEDNPNWKSPELRKKSEKKHLDVQYRYWMLQVKTRDNWKCKIANEDCDRRLESHHILDWVNYPELRYDINNGITLCQGHHPKTRDEDQRLMPVFQELVRSMN